MPLWPFGRKKRRTSTSSHAVSAVPNEKTAVSDARRDMASPMSTPTQTPSRPSSKRGSQRKRKAAPAASGAAGDGAATVTRSKRVEQPLRKTSVQDITALPGLRELESSPHLRPVTVNKAVIPYTLDRGSPARLGVSCPLPEQSTRSPAVHPSQSRRVGGGGSQRRRSSRRKEQALREEEIRAMSAPMQIPKRPAGVNNDLLRRDSKKARRTFSSKQRPDDHRGSNVSLPVSVPSTMSAASDQRGWQVGGIDVLNPRPTVRLSMPGYYPSTGSPAGLSRKGSKKGKLPAIAQESSRKDRRRIADLADDLDSSDLRTLLERDARRKEQKATEQHDRLERRLRRRAEKQRAEEEQEQERERERGRSTAERPLPTAVHPAFREHGTADDEVPIELLTPQTPESTRRRGRLAGRVDNEGTYLNYPAGQDIPQNPFDDPAPQSNPFADRLRDVSPVVERWSPIQTPMEEPVISTARAVRLSQGRISPPTSPPNSPPVSPLAHPKASSSLSELSDLQAQRSTSISRPFAHEQRRTSDSSNRRAGTWASIFRRGPSTSHTSLEHPGKVVTPSESSFANVSRESMSRQAIPAHLIQQASRRAGTPVRTQSRFHEDLPDAPISPPDSRIQSPELTIAAANVATARRAQRYAQKSDQVEGARDSPEPAHLRRTDSPVVLEEAEFELPVAQSLASIDSEGSWISGRPVQRRSTQRLHRDSAASAGSLEKHVEDFTGSFEKLPIPEHEYFTSLTPNVGSRQVSGEVVTPPAEKDVTPTPERLDSEENTPLRHGTAHRRPTVVHNEPRFKSREGLVAEYIGGAPVTPSRNRSSSSSGNSSETGSLHHSPIERSTVQNARSVKYGYGHAKSMSAGSAKMLDIPPARSGSKRASPSGSPALTQLEF